ncbi:hypothetical protein Golomagni_06822 [Golovinomyces magnicellulatus]|nr:hypothetical protein Golomagni_06822 [Golovinomyces magnicellulatus]
MSTDENYAPKSPDLSSLYASGPTDPLPQQTTPGYASQYHLQPPPPNFTSSYTPPVQGFNQNYIPPTQTGYQPPISGSFSSLTDPTFGIPPSSGFPPLAFEQQNPFPDPGPVPGPLDQQILPPSEDPGESSAMAPPKAAAIIEPSPVRTKFPTARIKRIMQADEEVGKVAQQTPIAVGKALEMFMVELVNKSADAAKEKGTKRVTAGMLKQVVESDDQWDFLRDIVSKVEPDKEKKGKTESDSDEDGESKKKVRGGKRKKSAA